MHIFIDKSRKVFNDRTVENQKNHEAWSLILFIFPPQEKNSVYIYWSIKSKDKRIRFVFGKILHQKCLPHGENKKKTSLSIVVLSPITTDNRLPAILKFETG